MKLRPIIVLVFTLARFAFSASVELDSTMTPGALCSEENPYFDSLYYDEQIPRCTRHVTHAMKQKIAEEYGVPESDWNQYEFDHLIPLCAGGSNDIKNLWPEPLDDAHGKDKIENDVCNKMRAGTMTQEEAVKQIWQWFEGKKH